MRVLYLSQYFPPEAGATQTRAHEMAKAWVRLGARVTMVCEMPNHPSGVVPPEYRGRTVERSELDGIEVIRVWVAASPSKTTRRRLLFYWSYMVNATIAGLLVARGPFDLIYATSPPLFVGAAGLALSVLRRTPMVFEVRDLWPASAVELGELSNPTAIRWAKRLEHACYRRARRIVVVTRGIRAALVEAGVPEEKLLLSPNGASPELFHFDPEKRARVRSDLGFNDGRFVAIYAGIHGIAQGLETVVEAARLLRAREDVHFVLVGEGPRKAATAALAVELGLTNLSMIPGQAREAMPGLLSAADAALVPLRAIPLFTGALPSKIFDAWCCERPVILGAEGESGAVLEAAGGGLRVTPEDPQSLVDAVLELEADPERRARMGRDGRDYTVRHHSRAALAEDLMEQLVGDRCCKQPQ